MATAPVVSDVLILGAGPAGLACAGGLARQLHTAVVFGNGAYRNARARHMHNVVGWDHADPSSYRAKAREEILARYPTIQFRDVGVRGVRRLDDDGDERGRKGSRFEVEDEEGERYLGRKVVLAMGMRDVMPDGPKGYEELWGYSIFHCLFCHGFEERGASSAGVLATGPLLGGSGGNGAAPLFAPVVSRMANRLAGSVTVYTDGDEELGSRIRAQLKSKTNFRMENRRVVQLSKDPGVEGEAGVLVTLEDGTVNREGFLVHAPALELNGPFAADLGVAITPQGHIDAQPPFYTTNVPGVYAAGDCATMMKAVPMATMMGGCVAAGLVHVLQLEDDVED
ncbi:FAD/NAD(P)-binding domain-containing protein [Hypoxylon rubiginosum]|uniref:FAD/NAD(P)-binding domain-containing protein n=1 Tax=Hypoxylon rubiginosum TaxID=110542 RepID=A0ACB9Z336_9PEZI|nr:FAD/NAD(P)-binding domain-containing protein [Hypoxylon rubiginosum]